MSDAATAVDTTAATTAADTSTTTTQAAATTAAETTTAATTAAATTTEAKPEATEAKTGAPEAYADFKLPDGYTLDAELGTEFKATAKALNLTQEQAQQLFDLGIKSNQSSAAKIQAMAATAKAQWQAESEADKEIGGAQAKENRAVAAAALDKFGTPELKKLLDESGLGQHPELIRWAYRVGKATQNDTFVPASKSKQADATSFYENSRMNP